MKGETTLLIIQVIKILSVIITLIAVTIVANVLIINSYKNLYLRLKTKIIIILLLEIKSGINKYVSVLKDIIKKWRIFIQYKIY